MSSMSSTKNSILKKTIQFGASTFISRMLGLLREILQARLLGVNAESDAFVAAFKIPNSLRKIFAEGALTGAFVPTIVSILKRDGRKSVNDLMTASFIVFEGILLTLCLFIFFFPYITVKLIVWGFSPEKIAYAVPFLRILIAFILFISSSALLSCALQAVNRFFIPAFAPVILNIFFIAGVLVCLWTGVSLNYLCGFIIAGSVAAFFMHLLAYFRANFSFGSLNQQAWHNFRGLITKFLPSMFGMSVVEINLFVDSTLASFLHTGAYTLLYLGSRLMQIPLGVFGVAFSSILLPHFSHVGTYAPKRLGFYILEAAKLVLWVTIPAAIFMMFFANKIFLTLFVTPKFPVTRVPEASYILIAALIGLFFFSLNKILLNIFYSLHDTHAPTITSIIFTLFNISASLILMRTLGAAGLALATSLAGLMQTLSLIYYLHTKYKFQLHEKYFFDFAWRYGLQLAVVMPIFWLIHHYLGKFISLFLPNLSLFLLAKTGFWLWTLPLMACVFIVLYFTRKLFGLRTHFLG